jgi:adenylylsulfate reductase subunit B
MPSYVNPEKCDGCKGGEKTACLYICPHDLMVLDEKEMLAYNQEPDQCWECYSCIKICPQGAITARPYADFAPMGGTSIPLRSAEDIMWTIQFRSGEVKRFKFPIRTTPEGSIDPFAGKPEAGDLEDGLLYTEKEMPTPKEVSNKKYECKGMETTQCWLEPGCEGGNR